MLEQLGFHGEEVLDLLQAQFLFGPALCTSDAPIVLVTQLGGTPDGTGTSTDPSGATISGGIDPQRRQAVSTPTPSLEWHLARMMRQPLPCHQHTTRSGHRRNDHTLFNGCCRLAIRAARRNARCRWYMERTKCSGRRHDRPGDDERRGVHLHRYRNGALSGRDRNGHRHDQHATGSRTPTERSRFVQRMQRLRSSRSSVEHPMPVVLGADRAPWSAA